MINFRFSTHLTVHVLGAGGVGGDEGEGDVGLREAVELPLGLLGGLPQPLHGEVVSSEVDSLVRLEVLEQVSEEDLVEVLSSEHGVSVGRLDLEDSSTDLEDGDIEGSCEERQVNERSDELRVSVECSERSSRSLLSSFLTLSPQMYILTNAQLN